MTVHAPALWQSMLLHYDSPCNITFIILNYYNTFSISVFCTIPVAWLTVTIHNSCTIKICPIVKSLLTVPASALQQSLLLHYNISKGLNITYWIKKNILENKTEHRTVLQCVKFLGYFFSNSADYFTKFKQVFFLVKHSLIYVWTNCPMV